MKVLIIEKDPVVAADMADLVRGFGHNVLGLAYDSETAPKLLAGKEVDLILLDLDLDSVNGGIKIAYMLKRNFYAPFAFIISDSPDNIPEAAKATGPLGFIVKPFDEKQIRSILASV